LQSLKSASSYYRHLALILGNCWHLKGMEEKLVTSIDSCCGQNRANTFASRYRCVFLLDLIGYHFLKATATYRDAIHFSHHHPALTTAAFH
jgi:hypothetical protein